MNSTDRGRKAEMALAQYLSERGYTVREQNWRTRWCEIDVIAQKADTIYFVEVKYRVTNRHGDGLEYITSRKLQQMQFAAELWVSSHDWRGEYCLAAASVEGDLFTVSAFIEL